MRRPIKNKIVPRTDIKYSSLLVSKFINKIMLSGKKSIATRVVYKALSNAAAKLNIPELEVLEKAISNVGPTLELKSRRIGGANYQVPVEVRPDRRVALAIRWIVDAARSQKGKTMEIKLSEELLNAVNNTGNAIKKKNDTHRMAEANKAFAHFAW